MSKFAIGLLIATLGVLWTLGASQPAVAQSGADTCQSCGDANGDGNYNIQDYVRLFSFLLGEGEAPALCSDVDGYDLITIRDATMAASLTPPSCVTQSKLVGQPNSQFVFSYVDHVGFYPFVSSVTFTVSIRSTSTHQVRAFDLPLVFKVAGQAPQTLSASLSGSNWPGGGLALQTDVANGSVLVTDFEGSVPAGTYTLCTVTMGMSPSPTFRRITVEYGELAPFMASAINPSDSACHYVMLLDENLDAWKPNLSRSECPCGDANGDLSINISDGVFLIAFIFAGGPAPNPICRGDSNGDGVVNITDVIYPIMYIFAGWPGPHCP